MERDIFGSSSVEDFFKFMGERHEIWRRRDAGYERPWTEDPILHEYKFTNVFRELDRGTIALRQMEEKWVDIWDEERKKTEIDWTVAGLIVFNTFWYRMLNLDVHAKHVGFLVASPDDLFYYLRRRYRDGKQIYTGAHMTNGGDPTTPKHEAHIPVFQAVWDERNELAQRIYESRSLAVAFKEIIPFRYSGPFISYEIVSDLRWSLMFEVDDVYTWANLGPGCKRGLTRLGLDRSVTAMTMLWARAKTALPPNLRGHFPNAEGTEQWPPFELREIEHCLCEFDKYERVRLGQGKMRSRYQ